LDCWFEFLRMNVCCERCVVHVDASTTGRSLVQGIPTKCVCVVQCVNVKQYLTTFTLGE
jgi:hypothetical protein